MPRTKFGEHKGGNVNYFDTKAPFIQAPDWWYPCIKSVPVSQKINKNNFGKNKFGAAGSVPHGTSKQPYVFPPDWFEPCINGKTVGSKHVSKSAFGKNKFGMLEANPWKKQFEDQLLELARLRTAIQQNIQIHAQNAQLYNGEAQKKLNEANWYIQNMNQNAADQACYEHLEFNELARKEIDERMQNEAQLRVLEASARQIDSDYRRALQALRSESIEFSFGKSKFGKRR